MDGVHGVPNLMGTEFDAMRRHPVPPGLLDLLGFLEGFIDRANHVKGLLWQVVTLTRHNHLEPAEDVYKRQG